jgi:hypothetical protein
VCGLLLACAASRGRGADELGHLGKSGPGRDQYHDRRAGVAGCEYDGVLCGLSADRGEGVYEAGICSSRYGWVGGKTDRQVSIFFVGSVKSLYNV